MAHRFIIGQTGTGKTTILSQWLIHDIHSNTGVLYLDLAGTTTDTLLSHIPPPRIAETYLYDPARFSVPFNPLITENPPFTAQALAEAIKTANGYGRISTPQMDSVLFNALMSLIEAKQGLFGLYFMLVSPMYREHVLNRVSNDVVKEFWHVFETLKDNEKVNYVASTFNKIQPLMADPRILAISHTDNRLPLNDIAQNGLLFLRLPQGEFGVERSALLASLLITTFSHSLMKRDSTVPFHLYIEDAHTLSPDVLITMLGTMRQHNVELTLTGRYLSEFDPRLMDAIRANCESYVFRTSYEDTDSFPVLPPQDIKPHELLPYTYWRFGDGRPMLEALTLPDFPTYPDSLRLIHSHHRRNLHAPQNRELAKLMEKFS